MFTMFLHVLQAECMKYRRSALLPLAIAVPLSMIVMRTGIFLYLRSSYIDRGIWNWDVWIGQGLLQWCTLFLPAFITLLTTLPAAMESSSWKFILVQPHSRMMIYSCKLLVTYCYLLLATFVLMLAFVLTGMFMQLHGVVALMQLLPFVMTTLAILPAVALQHWIATRVTNFLIPLGVGAAGVYLTFLSPGRALGYFVVWAYPVISLATFENMEPPIVAQPAFLFVIIPLGVLLCIVGAIDFAHRDVTL